MYPQGEHSEELNRREHTAKNVGAKRAVLYGYDAGTDNYYPITAIDNGDGTFSLKTAGAASGGGLTDTELRASPVDVTVTSETYSAVTVDATTSGDTTIVPITNTARLYYISLSANGANSADVTVVLKIGASEKYKVSLKAGSIFARNIGAGRRYITGAASGDIIVNLSAAQTVHVSVEYEDI